MAETEVPKPGQPQAESVQKMFDSISQSYDRANNFISFGLLHLWRKKLVRWSGVTDGDNVLDCATGTGDLAFEFKKAVGKGGVIGTDFSAEMLEVACLKAQKRNESILFESADVTKLQYPDNSFDAASIAFGLRNIQDPILALQEMARVVKPGGVVMVLETGQSDLPLFRELFAVYNRYLMPKIGGWLTGKQDAYQYLNRSSEKFPCGPQLTNLFYKTKAFQDVEFCSLNAGVVYMYKGRKVAVI